MVGKQFNHQPNGEELLTDALMMETSEAIYVEEMVLDLMFQPEDLSHLTDGEETINSASKEQLAQDLMLLKVMKDATIKKLNVDTNVSNTEEKLPPAQSVIGEFKELLLPLKKVGVLKEMEEQLMLMQIIMTQTENGYQLLEELLEIITSLLLLMFKFLIMDYHVLTLTTILKILKDIIDYQLQLELDVSQVLITMLQKLIHLVNGTGMNTTLLKKLLKMLMQMTT